jgi:hypothetical protein
MTLKEVGSAMGVSKERVRQLATRAIVKLRQAALERGLELPADRPAWESGPSREAGTVNRELAQTE